MTMAEKLVYCLDTSVYINSWRKRYPIDIDHFRPIWDKIDELGQAQAVFSPEEVFVEIKKQDDTLLEWLSKRRYLFRKPTEDVQRKIRDIMLRFPRLVDTAKGRSIADPWVIAQASVSSAVVVTDEQLRPNPGRSPRIPDVCETLGLPYMNTLEFIRRALLSK